MAATSDESWCLIESDPGLFTELIETVGVKDVGVEEVWCLDEALLKSMAPVYGLVFLFKWQKEEDSRVPETDYPGVFFASQVVQNACATQALLSILLNCDESKVDIGEHLRDFKSFTESMPPELKGLSLTNATVIRNAHNSFRPPDSALERKTSKKGKAEAAFHYVSYVPINGKLYELDGLKAGPLLIGEFENDNWVELVIATLEGRIRKYTESEVMFNLLAVTQSPAVTLGNRLQELKDQDGESSSSSSSRDQIAEVEEKLKQYTEKREKWRKENIRRRHDYTSFIVNMLQYLAENNQLKDILDQTLEEYGENYINH